MRRSPFIEVSFDVLLMAFRYALPRPTCAPDCVAAELALHWETLPDWMKEQVVSDIRRQKELYERNGVYNINEYSRVWDKFLFEEDKTG